MKKGKRASALDVEHDPIIETSFHSTPPLPELTGYLEKKNGKLCLRMGDTIVALKDGMFRLTKTWQPGNWDPMLYPTKRRKGAKENFRQTA